MATATRSPVASRLSFDWGRTGTPGVYALVVCESKARCDVFTRYAVEETESGSLLFAKAEGEDGPREAEVYEVRVGPRTCTCKGYATRGGNFACRHILAALDLMGN